MDVAAIMGFLLGVGASATFWYILYHRVIPTVTFFPKISVSDTSENPSGKKYRIRFQNVGRRSMLDVELFAKLRIQGLAESEPNTWRAIYIPIDDPRIPKVVSHRKSRKRLAVQLLVNSIDEAATACLPAELQLKRERNSLHLEDLMSLGSNTRLQIFCFGYDSFSGSRKAFESPEYKGEDLEPQ